MKKRSPGEVAIYARISKDSESEGAGVKRQEDDCRALAARLGLTVDDDFVFVDNDISASTKSKKVRPAFEEMMAAARAGQISVILAYSNSRLTRRVREFEDLIDLYEDHGVKIHTSASGTFDLSTADGRRMARFLAGEATAEAERTGERVERQKRATALAGEWRGGRRPFGYGSDGLTIREDEAKIVRDMTKAVLAGRSLSSLTHELNGAGIKTAAGGRWQYGGLRDVLLRPRNAGIVAHGRPGKNIDGYEYEVLHEKAVWPPLISREDWRALVEVLTDPDRRVSPTNEVRWLGSGIYVCGKCGAPMRAVGNQRKTKKTTVKVMNYRCSGPTAHLTVSLIKADERVEDVLTALLESPILGQDMQAEQHGELVADRARRVEAERRLKRVERDYDEEIIDGKRYRTNRDRLLAEIAAIDAKLAQGLTRSLSSTVLQAADPVQAYFAAPIETKRAVVADYIRVTIMPSGSERRSLWDASRVVITRPDE